METMINQTEILTELIKSFSIPASTPVKRFYEEKFHPILSDISLIFKGGVPLNNCYNHNNGITAIILNGNCYISPTHLIKEYILILSGLYLEDFKVPFSDTIYRFMDPKQDLKWQSLVRMREANLIAY